MPNWSGQQEDQHNGNHTLIGRSYKMAVPMNISSHREVGNLPRISRGKNKANETPYQRKPELQEADHETTYDRTITTPNAR